MQFLIIAYDGTDSEAPQRRQAVRAEHIKLGDKMRDEGHLLYAVAILDDLEQMKGSLMVLEFPSRAEFDGWLQVEPYVTGNVWKDIEVKPCRVGPSFTNIG